MTDEEKGKDTNIYDQDEIVATRSGRIIRPPTRFREFSALASIEHNKMLILGENNMFQSTEELNVMKYKTAMKSQDKQKWSEAVEKEHERMINSNVWTAVKKNTLSPDDKILTTTWAMKKKASGIF
jgi:hypothetical protein